MKKLMIRSAVLLFGLSTVIFSQLSYAEEKTTLLKLKKIGAVVKMLSDDGESWCKDQTEAIIYFDDDNIFENATADAREYIKYVDKLISFIGTKIFPVECPAANYIKLYYMVPHEIGYFEDWVLANRRTEWKPHRCYQSILSDSCSPLDRRRQETRPYTWRHQWY